MSLAEGEGECGVELAAVEGAVDVLEVELSLRLQRCFWGCGEGGRW